MKVGQSHLLRSYQIAELDISSKQKVQDDDLHHMLAISGGHQRSLDVSRCMNISNHAFKEISICIGLKYLDVSYTSFQDLSILENCFVLQSLCLSGIDLPTFSTLSRITSLELLNLSFSSIQDIRPISNLIKLRSLDLGNTDIQSIVSLEKCTRLEELLLECTDLHGSKCTTESIESLTKLTNLRFLSIAGTDLFDIKENLETTLGPDVYIELKSQKSKWLDAILQNDIQTVKTLISHGFNTHLRFGSWAMRIFAETYKSSRCKENIPFFNCDHADEELRPAAIHIALLMNFRDLVAILTSAKVILNERVWFGPMQCDSNNSSSSGFYSMSPIPVNTNTVSASKTIFTLDEFMKELGEKRYHSVTEDLIRVHPGDWRDWCSAIAKDLKQILNDPKCVELPPPDLYAHQLNDTIINNNKSNNNNSKTNSSNSKTAVAVAISSVDTTQPLNENSNTNKNEITVVTTNNNNNITSNNNATIYTKNNNNTRSKHGSNEKNNPNTMATTTTTTETISTIDPKSFLNKSSLKKPSDEDWKLHPMVLKMRKTIMLPKLNNSLINKKSDKILHIIDDDNISDKTSNNQQHKVPKPREMLGPKSYWNDSQGAALAQKAQVSMIKTEQMKEIKKQRERLLLRIPLDTGNEEDMKRTASAPVSERRDAFLDLLQKKADVARVKAAGKHRSKR
eukprot:gene4620-9177_t